MGIAAIPVGHAVRRIDADRLTVIRYRVAIVPETFERHAAAIVAGIIPGLAPDDFAAIDNGKVILAIVAVGDAARAVQPQQIRIEPDGFAVVSDGRLPPVLFRDQPLPEMRLPPLAETKGVFRIDGDGLGEIGDRPVEFTLFD